MEYLDAPYGWNRSKQISIAEVFKRDEKSGINLRGGAPFRELEGVLGKPSRPLNVL